MRDFGRIALGVRIGQLIDPAFFISWTRLISGGLRPGDVVLHPAVHLPHAIAANALVTQFLGTGCDSLLFLDDDHVFEPDALELLRASDPALDVASGLYTTRRHPFNPIVLANDGDGVQRVQGPLRDIVRCDVVGLGFTLIRRRVLSDGCFKWDNVTGEDGDFCRRIARDMGAAIGVNCDVRVGHRVAATAYWQEPAQVKIEWHTFGVQATAKQQE